MGNTIQSIKTRLKYNLFGLNMSQQEVADELGISQQYVALLERSALQKFKRRFCNSYPDTWRLIQHDIESGWFGRK